MKTTLMTVAALALVACSGGEEDPTLNDGAQPVMLKDDKPAEPTTTTGATKPGATAPGAPVVTLLASLPKALDFEVRGADTLVLYANRIEACTTAGCTVEVSGARMPPTSPTQASASLGLMPGNTLLVAQKGTEKCSDACTTDSARLPGIYAVSATAAPRRIATTMPLTFAKAFRETDGWLVGSGRSFAVASSWNNEDFTHEAGTMVAQGIAGIGTTALSRGTAGPLRKTLPFVFVGASAMGIPSFANTGASFQPVPELAEFDGHAVAASATATTDASPVLVLHAVDTPDGDVFLAPAENPKAITSSKFPGLTGIDELVGTTTRIAAYDPAKGALRTCTIEALHAVTCQPVTTATGLDRIVRVRAVDDSLYVLGLVSGTPRLVKVTF